MKTAIGNIGYWIIYTWALVHAILPLKVLYIFSDILYVLAYHLVGYRKKTVRTNLKNSFPEKTKEELYQIEKRFYRHLCDYFFETIKLLHISEEEIRKRMVFHNLELITDRLEEGRSCFLYLGHYGNWEWVPSIMLQMPDDTFIGQIYRPLTNSAFERLFLKIRTRFKTYCIKKNDTFREIVKRKRANEKMLIGFISDQTPSEQNIGYWTTFMNQETPVFLGVEKISKKIDASVAYLDMKKVGRGMYEGTCRLITDAPASETEFAITERYVRSSEETIMRDPAFWLWSHRRWKYRKTDVKNR